MKITKLSVLIIPVFAILVGILVCYCSASKDSNILIRQVDNTTKQGASASPPSHVKAGKFDVQAAFLDTFKTPIEIYGKVVDQHGDPVPGATVKLYPLDTPWESSKSSMTISSDSEGKFSARGLNGASLGVQAFKKGYHYIPSLGGPASSVTVEYSDGAASGKRHSNPTTPVVLELHKIGPVEPMFYMPDTRWKLAIDGTPRVIALDSKDGLGTHQIEFQFWSDTHIRELPGNNSYTVFDWTFEAKITGGGFIWNESSFNFEAPEKGYKETIRYHFPATTPREAWKRIQHGRYFVKFADGSYARIRFDIDGGSDNGPLKMSSWLCLKPGSRNLASPDMDSSMFSESDPEQK